MWAILSAYRIVHNAYVWITSYCRLQETDNRCDPCSQLFLGSSYFFRQSSTCKNTVAMQSVSALVALCPLSCSSIHLAGSLLTQTGPKKLPSRLSDWGKVCVWLPVSACEIILQGCVYLICPTVAKRVYFWFGRRPLNCQLIMQRKCYSQLVNFFWPWFLHRGKYLGMISQNYTA